MGMDVYGVAPSTKAGEYFRNNVWYWHPLWDYCINIAANDLISEDVASDGHMNSGAGLDEAEAVVLSNRLFAEIASGATAEYKRAYDAHLASLPRRDCTLCGTTGIRTDAVGVSMGMPERVLEPEMQILTGRERGWCNSCGGEGKQDAWDTNYPFDVDNVREFAEFLAGCGGFEIC